MGIIVARLHNMGGNHELVDKARKGATFKKHQDGGPIATYSGWWGA